LSHGAPASVEVEGLVHRYGARVALDGVSFLVRAGELFGLLGPNGGGKTTLLQILATLRRPTGGIARVAGFDVRADPAAVRRAIGVVFQHPGLDPHLTAAENLRHQGHLYGLRGRGLGERARELLERFGLGERRDALAGALSGGLRRRVELAKGLLHEPRVLLLDEPTVGLDPGGRRDLWSYVRDLRRETGITVLVTTHLMDEAERCDRIGILDRGQLVALDTPAGLRAGIRGDVISLATDEPETLAGRIRDRFGDEVTVVDGAVRIERASGAEFVPRLAEAFPGAIRSITVGEPTLEDVFVQRTGHHFYETTEETA
jgi:ABC-2 type transport system ATP-binding protein